MVSKLLNQFAELFSSEENGFGKTNVTARRPAKYRTQKACYDQLLVILRLCKRRPINYVIGMFVPA